MNKIKKFKDEQGLGQKQKGTKRGESEGDEEKKI